MYQVVRPLTRKLSYSRVRFILSTKPLVRGWRICVRRWSIPRGASQHQLVRVMVGAATELAAVVGKDGIVNLAPFPPH